MSKGNQKARKRAIADMNWWEFLINSQKKNSRSSIIYLDYDDIIYRTKQCREVEQDRKKQKRINANIKNMIKFAKREIIPISKRRGMKNISVQIQYGFDLAKWWMIQHA